MKIIVAIAIVLGLAGRADAHPLDMGYLRLDPEAGIQLTLDFDVNVAGQVLGVEPMTLDATTVAARASDLADATYRLEPPAMNGKPCTWGTAKARLVGRSVSLSEHLACPSGAATWDLAFIHRMSATFQVLVKIHGDDDQVIVLDRSNSKLSLAAGAQGFGADLWSGVVHVGLSAAAWRGGGVPTPIQHLVLVIALVIAGGTILQLLAIGGMYALGHVLGGAVGLVVTIPGMEILGWVIAAAIIATALTKPHIKQRWIAAGVAGIAHGLAVGPALSGLSAVVAMSLGVGVAQLAIILLIGPPIAYLRKG